MCAVSSGPSIYFVCFTSAAKICVLTNDGRNIQGNLRGFDQVTNLILDGCHERIYSSTVRKASFAST